MKQSITAAIKNVKLRHNLDYADNDCSNIISPQCVAALYSGWKKEHQNVS